MLCCLLACHRLDPGTFELNVELKVTFSRFDGEDYYMQCKPTYFYTGKQYFHAQELLILQPDCQVVAVFNSGLNQGNIHRNFALRWLFKKVKHAE